jgi:uncharacterized protein (DUF736 family)
MLRHGVSFPVPSTGWSRTAPETGTDHISLKLDDQTFNASVYASPVQGGKREHGLI